MSNEEKWQETALVDIAYEVLSNSAKSRNYRDVFQEAANLKGLSDEELLELLPQVFTEMNLDGRFICISPSEWGLKKWYTTEAIEESIEALARSKGIDDDDDDVYGFEDEEEVEDFTEDEEFEADADSDEEEEEVDEDEVEEDLDEDLTEDLVEEGELAEEFEDEDADFDEDADGAGEDEEEED